MPRKSTVAELQAEEATVSSPLRRSSRKTSTTQEAAPAPTTPARVTRGRRASAAQDKDDITEVSAPVPAAIGPRRTSQAEAPPLNPARATRSRRTSAAAQDDGEVVEVKAAVVKPRRASILEEENTKPATPSRRGRKPSITAESLTENAEVEKPKAVRGRRASAKSEADQAPLPAEKPASAVRGRRKSASVELPVEVEVIEVPPKTPSRTTRRRTSAAEQSSPPEEVATPAKRTTRGRKASEDAVETGAADKVATPARRTTRGRKPSVTEEPVEEPDKKTAPRSRKKSENADQTEEIPESAESEVEIFEMNFVDETNEVTETSDTEDISPTALRENVARLMPIKKKKLLEPLVNELDLSIINESMDDAETSKQGGTFKDISSEQQQKESTPSKSNTSPNNLQAVSANDKLSLTSGSSFVSTTSGGSFASSISTASSDVLDDNLSSNSTLVAEPIKVNGDIPSPEKEMLSLKSPRLNKSKEISVPEIEKNIKNAQEARRRSRSNSPGGQQESLTVEVVDKTGTLRRSPRQTKGESPPIKNHANNTPDLNVSKQVVKATNSVVNAKDEAVEKKRLAEKSLISDGSDGSFRFNLNISLDTLSNQDKTEDLNDSKGSNGSNKENLNTPINEKVEKEVIFDTPVLTVGRVSNVFKPNQKEFSFCEPMDVDQSVCANKTNVTITDNDLTRINESILENESTKTERSFLIQEETSVLFHIRSKSEGGKKSALGMPLDTSGSPKESKSSPVNTFSKAFKKLKAEELQKSNVIEIEKINIPAGDAESHKLQVDDSLKVPELSKTSKINAEDSTCYDFDIPSDDDDEFLEENKSNNSKTDNKLPQVDNSTSVRVDESTITGEATESTRYDFEVPPSDDDEDLMVDNNLSPICNSKILNKSFDKRTDGNDAKYEEENESNNKSLSPKKECAERQSPEKRKSKSPLASRSFKSPKLDESINKRNNTSVEAGTDICVIESNEESVTKSEIFTNLRSSKRISKSPRAGKSEEVITMLSSDQQNFNNTVQRESKSPKIEKVASESDEVEEVKDNIKKRSLNKRSSKSPRVSKNGDNEEDTESVPQQSDNSRFLSKSFGKSATDGLLNQGSDTKDRNAGLKNSEHSQNDLFDLDTDTEKSEEKNIPTFNTERISKENERKAAQNDLFDEDTDPEDQKVEESKVQNDLFDLDTDEETTKTGETEKRRSKKHTKTFRKSLDKLGNIRQSTERIEIQNDNEIKVEIRSSPTKNATSIKDMITSIVSDDVEDPQPLSDDEDNNDCNENDEDVFDEDNTEENEFIDGMAEEGEEDTPSEGSNDIVDEGESIGSSDSEAVEDEDYENDSFVCEDEYQELLSGDEYDLGEDKKEKPIKLKKSRIINVEGFHDDAIIKLPSKKVSEKERNSRQRSRIITVSDSSEDEATERTETEITENIRVKENTSEIMVENASEVKDISVKGKAKEGEAIEAESANRCLDKHKETDTDIDNKPECDLIEPIPDVSTFTNKFKGAESSIICLDSSVTTGMRETSPKRRKSSINIHESLVLDGSQEKLSKRINSLVETFCGSMQGEVSLNLSLEFEDTGNKVEDSKNLPSPSKGINIISDIKITPCQQQNDDAQPSCSKDFTSNERKSKRLSVTSDDIDADLPSSADSPEESSKRRKLSKSLDDVSQVKKNNKKLKKRKHSKQIKNAKLDNAPSLANLRHTTFNLISDLVTDIKNRPRRTIKPSVPNPDYNSSWETSSAKNVKPSKYEGNHREKLELVSLKFHPKDFKNQTLADSKRVQRDDTRILLKKKGAFK